MTENEKKLITALRFLWGLRKRDDPVFVLIDYTARRTVRGIIGRELAEELDR